MRERPGSPPGARAVCTLGDDRGSSAHRHAVRVPRGEVPEFPGRRVRTTPRGSRLRAVTAVRASLALAILASFRAHPVFAARPTFLAYFAVGLEDTSFQGACVAKVQAGWVVPAELPRKGSKTVVQSTIGRDGKLVGAIVTMKSGSKEWDTAALAAVKKASPFPPLPKTFAGSQAEVHWHFSLAP